MNRPDTLQPIRQFTAFSAAPPQVSRSSRQRHEQKPRLVAGASMTPERASCVGSKAYGWYWRGPTIGARCRSHQQGPTPIRTLPGHALWLFCLVRPYGFAHSVGQTRWRHNTGCTIRSTTHPHTIQTTVDFVVRRRSSNSVPAAVSEQARASNQRARPLAGRLART